MASKTTPFVEGNDWRFTNDNQPKRRLTLKQLEKRLESLLNATQNELQRVKDDADEPCIIRVAATQILTGQSIEVLNMINSIKDGRKQS